MSLWESNNTQLILQELQKLADITNVYTEKNYSNYYLKSQLPRYYYTLQLVLQNITKGKVLDIGSYPGHLMKILLNLGFAFQSEQEHHLIEVNNTLVLLRVPAIKKDEAVDETVQGILYDRTPEKHQHVPELRHQLQDESPRHALGKKLEERLLLNSDKSAILDCASTATALLFTHQDRLPEEFTLPE